MPESNKQAQSDEPPKLEGEAVKGKGGTFFIFNNFFLMFGLYYNIRMRVRVCVCSLV